MKILQVCAIDATVDALLKPLHQILCRQEYTVHIACTNTGVFFTKLENLGFHMIHVPIDRKIDPVSNVKSIVKLAALMRKEKYDVVHVHTPIASVLGRIAARLAGIPKVIYTAHGFYFHEGMPKMQYQLFYTIEKICARAFTDVLHLVSWEDYQLSLRKRFKTKECIFHINNGVDFRTRFNPDQIDATRISQLKKELSIKQDDLVIAFVGRMVREKGIFELVEAFKQLQQTCKDAKLLMIGELFSSERDQTSFRSLEKVFRQEKNIIATGYRQDIPNLLAISDIFTLPSHREGLPLSILEAMAMKKPVVATDIRGCREEVIHGENGFLVEKYNSTQLYERLQQLANSEELRTRFGENGRKRVKQFFDDKKSLQQQLEVYLRLQEEG